MLLQFQPSRSLHPLLRIFILFRNNALVCQFLEKGRVLMVIRYHMSCHSLEAHCVSKRFRKLKWNTLSRKMGTTPPSSFEDFIDVLKQVSSQSSSYGGIVSMTNKSSREVLTTANSIPSSRCSVVPSNKYTYLVGLKAADSHSKDLSTRSCGSHWIELWSSRSSKIAATHWCIMELSNFDNVSMLSSPIHVSRLSSLFLRRGPCHGMSWFLYKYAECSGRDE